MGTPFTQMLTNTSKPNHDNETVNPANLPVPNRLQLAIMWLSPILMILLNILVFIVVPRMRSIRPCTGYGMISLAMADFFLGIVHLIRLSFNTYSGYQLEESLTICILDGYGQPLFASISIVTLTFLNLDRLLTISFPLKYPNHMSHLRVKLAHVVIWCFMIIFLSPLITGMLGTRVKYHEHAFMCVIDWAGNLPYNLILLILVDIIPTGMILICFVGIFLLARKKTKALRKGNSVQVHQGPRQAVVDTQWKKDLRIFRTLAIMTFGFYVAWSPYFITVAIPEMIIGRSLNHVTDFIAPWLGASNSFWNPIIYIPTMKPFSDAMFCLLGLPCNTRRCTCGRRVMKTQKCECGGGLTLSLGNSEEMETSGLSMSNRSVNAV